MRGKETDKEYIIAEKALKKGVRRFVLILKRKLLLAECFIDENNKIRFRNRKWVSRLKLLKTEIIYQTHVLIFIKYSEKKNNI